MWVNNLLKVITRRKSVTAGIWTCDLQIQKPTRYPLSHRVPGSFLCWCVIRPANQPFFIHSCIYVRILIISYLATFLGTKSFWCAVKQSISHSYLLFSTKVIREYTWCFMFQWFYISARYQFPDHSSVFSSFFCNVVVKSLHREQFVFS